MTKQVFQRAAVILLSLLAVAAAIRCAGEFRAETALPRSYDGAKAAFVLRDWHGYVSVFDADDPREPLQVTDIPTESLRRADRSLLRDGITVGSRECLLMLLEDLRA